MADSRADAGRRLVGVAACVLSCTLPTDSAQLPFSASESGGGTSDTALVLVADTYIVGDFPNANYGTSADLWVGNGPKRTLVRFDQAEIEAAVGAGILVSAQLQFTITVNPWGWGAGRPVDVHRLTQAWTEAGATWNCAVDAVPGDSTPDCSEDSWEMGAAGPNPWATTPTATLTILNGMTGVVPFDVTADVASFLGGTVENHGWSVKATDESLTGKMAFGSRETDLAPVLVITVAPQESWPVLVGTLPDLDTSKVVVLPSGRLMYRTDITLRFDDDVPDSAKTVFFAEHSMAVVGVTQSGSFFVRIPDPGSLDSLYALLQQIRSEPGISAAAGLDRTAPEPIVNARFPEDGLGQTRSDWLTPTSGTWAMRAIRAQFAWGCETGTYGGSLPAMGIVEWKHQETHPELARSSTTLWEPPDAQLAQVASPVAPSAQVALLEGHGTATTGLLAAEGDNKSGIAGVNWETDLHLYAGLSSGNRPLPIPGNFFAFADAIVGHEIRVLSLTMDATVDSTKTVAEREGLIRWLALEIENGLLNPLPSLLVVVAAGNNRYRNTASAYLQSNRANVILAALLLLRENASYRDRIIVVAGTTQGNNFWDVLSQDNTQGSNFFTGETDIAAPAEDVTVLERWTGQTGSAVPLTVGSGTSFATPLVAGTAGLLLAMDSTLTPAQVKDYILRGAKEPRLSGTSGQMVMPDSVQGAPETVYQLDAYGALKLLPSERAGVVPICGYPVTWGGTVVNLEAPNDTISLEIPSLGAAFPRSASVAQGGRLMSVYVNGEGGPISGFSILMSHRGDLIGTTSVPVRKVFLEKDTVDIVEPVLPILYPQFIIRHGDGSPDSQFEVFSQAVTDTLLETFGFNPVLSATVSPDARWLAGVVQTTRFEGDTLKWYVISLTGGSAWVVANSSNQSCPTGFTWPQTPPSWSQDSRRVVFTLPCPTGISSFLTVVQSFDPANGTLTVQHVPDYWLLHASFLAGDSIAQLVESSQNPSGDCRLTRRRAADFSVLLTQEPRALCAKVLVFNARTAAVIPLPSELAGESLPRNLRERALEREPHRQVRWRSQVN